MNPITAFTHTHTQTHTYAYNSYRIIKHTYTRRTHAHAHTKATVAAATTSRRILPLMLTTKPYTINAVSLTKGTKILVFY